MKTYLELIKIDLKLALRQRTVIFFNYLFPLIFFFTFATIFRAAQDEGSATQVMTMAVAMGILGNGLFGAGMRAVQEREMNILRRYKVTPLTPGPILVASMVTGWVLFMPYVLLILTLAHRIYHMPWPEHMGEFVVFLSLGLIAFRSLGLVIASVANTMQESVILVQLCYFPMLFLSGATFPIDSFSNWLKIVSRFIPSTYLVEGVKKMMLQHEGVVPNWKSVGALLVTGVLGWILGVKLFRWEKEEKVPASSKLWVLAALLPFVLLGAWQAYSKEDLRKNKIMAHEMARRQSFLITGARIIVGNGKVIESGSVLVRNGKIAEVYDNTPDAKALNAEVIDAAGKTVLPGLIDVHVHLGAPGGFYADPQAYVQRYMQVEKSMERELAAYLYSGVTAVKSVGDTADSALKTRSQVNSSEALGAELFVCGPLFTTDGGHGTEYAKYMPANFRANFDAQFVRTPKTAQEARQQVDELKALHVDGIKAVMEAGTAGMLFNRMDPALLNAVAAEARADHLPITVHTGDSRDVADALAAGGNGIEHGSFRDSIPEALWTQMSRDGVFYDPTLSVVEAYGDLARGKTNLLKRSLVQQVGPRDLLRDTEQKMAAYADPGGGGAAKVGSGLATAQANLLHAYQNHVLLVAGSDAGNPLVIHGPTVQHELELWVKAGIPPEVALQAATYNAARFLGVDNRIGSIRKGNDANLLIVEGNPLQDISVLERISRVIFKGEIVGRSGLLEQD
jgi:imidazolonepropionase-like amidohydrolase/ABC-type multidrug transport system permease subunit